jgi:hypothetical protein
MSKNSMGVWAVAIFSVGGVLFSVVLLGMRDDVM